MPDTSAQGAVPEKSNRRLDSWKEIATYLGRGVRTVQRWEETDGLPVHRLLHSKGVTVYAITGELDQWWNSRRDNLVELPGETPEVVPASPALATEPIAAVPTVPPAKFPPARQKYFLGIALLVILTSAGVWVLRQSQPEFVHLEGRPFTFWPGYEVTPSFSPDGETIAFASRAIYLQRVGSDQAIALTHSDRSEIEPVWSPDGRQIAFFRQESSEQIGIYITNVTGDQERRIDGIHASLAAARLDFSPDGSLLATSDRNAKGAQGMVLIAVASGARQWLSDTKSGDDWCPRFSPDGNTIAFVRATVEGAQDLYLMAIHTGGAGGQVVTGPVRRLTQANRAIYGHTWTADGRGLITAWRRNGAAFELWRIPVSGGRPILLSGTQPGPIQPSVSRTGHRLAYVSRFTNISIWRAPLDGTSGAVNLVKSSQGDTDPQYSPDGRRLAFRSSRSGFGNLWVSDVDGTHAIRVTNFHGENVGPPRWSADGQSLAFGVGVEGRWQIQEAEARAGAASRSLPMAGNSDMLPVWSRDGAVLYFASNRSGTWELWRQPTGGGQAVQLTRAGGFNAQESYDGQTIYYSKGQSIPGIWKLPGEQLVIASASAPRWGWAVGRSGIYYVDAEDKDQPADIRYFDLQTGITRTVARTSGKPAVGGTCLGVSRDEHWITWAQVDRAGSDIILVEGFR